MPPESKQIINSIEQMTCENCLYSNKHWQEETVKCRLDISDELSDFCKISNVNFFCSHGLWRMIIAVGRPSIVDFQVAYDYLEGK